MEVGRQLGMSMWEGILGDVPWSRLVKLWEGGGDLGWRRAICDTGWVCRPRRSVTSQRELRLERWSRVQQPWIHVGGGVGEKTPEGKKGLLDKGEVGPMKEMKGRPLSWRISSVSYPENVEVCWVDFLSSPHEDVKLPWSSKSSSKWGRSRGIEVRKSRKSVSLLPLLFLTDSSFQEDLGAPSPPYWPRFSVYP